MSRLQVQRQKTDHKTYLLGEMSLDSDHICFTLEPAYERLPHPGIPSGTYPLELQPSGKVYTWMVLHLEKYATTDSQKSVAAAYKEYGAVVVANVPNRLGIEIHIGNFPHDSEGCTLTGQVQIEGEVTGSTIAYFNFYPIVLSYIQSDPEHTIDYLDIGDEIPESLKTVIGNVAN